MLTCAFFKFCLYCIYIVSITFSCPNCYSDCRRKLNSIKSESFEGVNWKFLWKFSICLNLRVFFVFFLRNLNRLTEIEIDPPPPPMRLWSPYTKKICSMLWYCSLKLKSKRMIKIAQLFHVLVSFGKMISWNCFIKKVNTDEDGNY